MKLKYVFLIIIIFLAMIYLYNFNKKTTTGNPKADKQLKEEKLEKRPHSGEINF